MNFTNNRYKCLNRITFGLFAIVVIGVLFSGSMECKAQTDQKQTYEKLKIFAEVLYLVQTNHVKEFEDITPLIYAALEGLVQEADPDSAFIPPDLYQEMMQEGAQENQGGIGVQIGMREKQLTVIAPIDDTPAFWDGIKAGDKIIKIDDTLTENLSLMEAVHLLRGPVGSQVTISIERAAAEPHDFIMTRELIEITSVSSKMLENNIGYVRLKQFREESADELEHALEELERQAMKTLILDLRSNPGGLLNACIEVTDKFLEKGKLIVYTEGRKKSQDMRFISHDTEHPAYPLVILIDQGSAAASEIVAGTLQYHQRALVVGTKSYGRGSIQSVIPLSDGSGLRLTTAYYFLPNEQKIDQHGILPDVIVTSETEEQSVTPEIPTILVNDTDEDEDNVLDVAIDIITQSSSPDLEEFKKTAGEIALGHVKNQPVESFVAEEPEEKHDERSPDELFLDAVKHGDVEAARAAINAGVDVNADLSGTTALIIAAQHGHVDMARLLLDHHADVNAVAGGGFTALMNAAYYGHQDIVTLLLESGADANAQTENGKTALSLAQKKKRTEVVELLEHARQNIGQPAASVSPSSNQKRMPGQTGAEGTTHIENEVQFWVPPNWQILQQPAEGITVQVSPDISSGQTWFAYMNKQNAPMLTDISPQLMEGFLDEVGVGMQKFIELQGSLAELKQRGVTEIHGYKALDFHYETSTISGEDGFVRLVMLIVSENTYGFMGMSTSSQQTEDQEIFEKIIQSITIDESKISADAGPKSYSEIIQHITNGVEPLLQIMPSEWEWRLETIEMGAGEHREDLFIHLSLNRNDALALVNGLAVIIDAFKRGVDPNSSINTDELQCNPHMLTLFIGQISQIFGAAANTASGNQNLPIQYIYIDVSDPQGKTSRKCFVEVTPYVKAVQTMDETKILPTMGCE